MVTGDLAQWAAQTGFDALPAETVAAGKRLLLDSLGCLIGGAVNEPGRIAARAVARLSGPAQAATALVTGTKFSARDAAFINGVTLYSVGLNGYHKGAMLHPGASVIPALLAVGEERDSSGRDMLTAMTLGYEVCARIGAAMAPGYLERGFNGNGTIGTFGATAAAGHLLGLSAAQLRHAFGINGSQAAGLNEWHHDAAMTILFHAGRAAQNAVEAVVLAQEGLTGPATILEGREGFCQALCEGALPEGIVRDLNRFDAFGQTTMRPHFGATSTIAASSGAVDVLRQLGAGPDAIASVTVRTHSGHVAAHDLARPETVQGARQSLQFNVAQAIGGGVLVRDIVEADLFHPAVQQVLPLIAIISDDGIARFGAEVTIRLKDGRSAAILNTAPLGDPANPLDGIQVAEKFLAVTAGAGTRVAQGPLLAVVDAVADFEQWQGRKFIALLKAAAAAVKVGGA